MILAVTGGTGFVGAHLLRLAVETGHRVRALTRSPREPQPGVTWIPGDLRDPGDLCAGAEAVIHLAGVINARRLSEFFAGNVAGTATLLAAAESAGARRFVHVSSLSAREPGLSAYGASKAASERLVADSGLGWSIVRPPGVYGPGDRETLALFQLAARGLAVVPWRGCVSMIEVGDLARALLALAAAPATRATHEIDDGAPVAHGVLARTIGDAVGRRVRVLRVPAVGLTTAAAFESAIGRLRRRLPRLSLDRARYLAHPDWVARGDNLVGLWTPRVGLAEGTAMTAAWYRARGWLRA